MLWNIKKKIKILVQMRIQSNLIILEECDIMEQARKMTETIACYADGGFQNLIKNRKDVL